MKKLLQLGLVLASTSVFAQGGDLLLDFNGGETYEVQKVLQVYDSNNEPDGYVLMAGINKKSQSDSDYVMPYLILSRLDDNFHRVWEFEFAAKGSLTPLDRITSGFVPMDIVQLEHNLSGFVVVGYSILEGSIVKNGVVLNFDTYGNLRWSKEAEIDINSIGSKYNTVVQNPVSGNLIIGGESFMDLGSIVSSKALLVELDQNGGLIQGGVNLKIDGTKNVFGSLASLNIDLLSFARINDIVAWKDTTSGNVLFGAAGVANELIDLNGNVMESDVLVVAFDDQGNIDHSIIGESFDPLQGSVGEVKNEFAKAINWHYSFTNSFTLMIGGGVENTMANGTVVKDALFMSVDYSTLTSDWIQTMDMNGLSNESFGESVSAIVATDDASFAFIGSTENTISDGGSVIIPQIIPDIDVFGVSVQYGSRKIFGNWSLNKHVGTDEIATGVCNRGHRNTSYRRDVTYDFFTSGRIEGGTNDQIQLMDGQMTFQANYFNDFGCNPLQFPTNPIDRVFPSHSSVESTHIASLNLFPITRFDSGLNEKSNCGLIARAAYPEQELSQEGKVISESNPIIPLNQEYANFVVYTMTGQVALRGASVSNQIDLSELSSGVYLVSLIGEKSSRQIKVIRVE